MHPRYEPIVEALEGLATALKASSTEARSFMETHGWNYPAVDRIDLVFYIRKLQDVIRSRAPDEELTEEEDVGISQILTRISVIQANIPYIFNGNGAQAIPAYILSLDGILIWLERKWPERENLDPNSLPAKLARHSRNAKARIDQILDQVGDLDEKIKRIESAHQTAESLPADLEDLRQLRANLIAITGQSQADASFIDEKKNEGDLSLKAIQALEAQAQTLVANCEEAYRITTTKGLAGAFDQRAKALNISMWIWVFGLTCSLSAVAFIGQNRVAALTEVLAGDPKWGTVTLNFLLSAISVGAPLWFAWVSTKQIGQRFRLSEDYGFKASVAKAYEGYRREAARIDEKFEAQLFSIALTRLEEAPLRTVESATYGSPWQEIIANTKQDPGLAARLLAFVQKESSARKSSTEASD